MNHPPCKSGERLYLYAIADHPPQLEQRGIRGAPVRTLPSGELAAVVSPIEDSTISAAAAELWAHEQVIEALLSTCPVLPVRFGVVLPNENAVLAALRAHGEQFTATLGHVRGRVELALRVMWADKDLPIDQELPSPRDGHAYLLARLQQERQISAWRERARLLAEPIHSALGALAADSVFQLLETPRLLLTAAYLVERDQVAGFRETVQALQCAHTDLRFLCTGPWPAYSFAHIAICTNEEAI